MRDAAMQNRRKSKRAEGIGHRGPRAVGRGPWTVGRVEIGRRPSTMRHAVIRSSVRFSHYVETGITAFLAKRVSIIFLSNTLEV